MKASLRINRRKKNIICMINNSRQILAIIFYYIYCGENTLLKKISIPALPF
ncbi:hypothetical protein COPEUT_01338 [Coprococcus eutactus ATCC 27759]|nr:hypothetical protein COPEUT_01338 [Coprococcus eutactus ATCC 27759]